MPHPSLHPEKTAGACVAALACSPRRSVACTLPARRRGLLRPAPDPHLTLDRRANPGAGRVTAWCGGWCGSGRPSDNESERRRKYKYGTNRPKKKKKRRRPPAPSACSLVASVRARCRAAPAISRAGHANATVQRFLWLLSPVVITIGQTKAKCSIRGRTGVLQCAAKDTTMMELQVMPCHCDLQRDRAVSAPCFAVVS